MHTQVLWGILLARDHLKHYEGTDSLQISTAAAGQVTAVFWFLRRVVARYSDIPPKPWNV